MDQKEIDAWNKEAKKKYHKKIVDTRINGVKTVLIIIGIIIALGFLALYAIRTYYNDFYRDIVETTNICEPSYNITVESQDCSEVNVECNCLTPGQLEQILDDVCPDTININMI